MRKMFWRTLFWAILIVGIWALFPASEIAGAREWLKVMRGWLR
jgi:cell division protein FtsW (lipid II flippase)